jgi:hypothetical protein
MSGRMLYYFHLGGPKYRQADTQENDMQAINARRLTIASAMFLVSVIVVPAALLDGMKFKVKVVPDKVTAEKGAKEFDDELIFADGKFTSTTLLRKGFKPSKYYAETEPNEAEFEVEQRSAGNGVATWTGEIRGTNALGGLSWLQKNGTNFTYDFTGTKQ